MHCVHEMFLVTTGDGFEFLIGSGWCEIKVGHDQKGDIPLIEQILLMQDVRVRRILEGPVLPGAWDGRPT